MPDAKKPSQAAAPPLRLALFEPDIPQNAGTILRMAACFAIPVSIISPAGFPTSHHAFRRAGMDYLDQVAIDRHVDWADFEDWRRGRGHRLVLCSTKATLSHVAARYQAGDILLLGRESAGVPDHVRDAADLAIRIPMQAGLRSLNVAVSAALITGEALRQLNAFPETLP